MLSKAPLQSQKKARKPGDSTIKSTPRSAVPHLADDSSPAAPPSKPAATKRTPRPSRARQGSLDLGRDHVPRTEHGGSLAQGRRKLARPLDPKRPAHVVVRSERAKGTLSLLHPSHERKVRRIVDSSAARHGVRVYQYANSGNHLHLVIKGRTRLGLQNFLRAITGRIARAVTGACKGNATGKFWDALAYTRVANWGRAFEALKSYVLINEIEAAGLFGYRRKPPSRP